MKYLKRPHQTHQERFLSRSRGAGVQPELTMAKRTATKDSMAQEGRESSTSILMESKALTSTHDSNIMTLTIAVTVVSTTNPGIIGGKMITTTIGRVDTISSKDTTNIMTISDITRLLRTSTRQEMQGTLRTSLRGSQTSCQEFSIFKENQFTLLTTTVTP